MHHPRRRFAPTRRLRAGFTLLEIIVVIAILGLLAGLAIANVDKLFGNAKLDIARQSITSMKVPLTTYRLDLGDYPATAEGLTALASAPSTRADRWRGPYVADGKLPLDPWNEPYQYRYPGQKNKDGYDLWSKGPDRVDGTQDDIGNWAASEAK
jgi:general secretion pathway protein G